MDNVPKETHVVSPMILHLGTDARIRKEKDNRPLLHQIQRQRLTGKNPSTDQAAEVRALGQEGADSRADKKIVKTRHVITGILPYVRVTSQKQDAVMATSAAQQRSKKCGRKGSVELLKESIQLGCVSQEPRPRKSILWKEGALRSNHAVKFPKAPGTKQKLGKERVHREESFKGVNLMSAVFAHPSLRSGHKRKPCTKKGCAEGQVALLRE